MKKVRVYYNGKRLKNIYVGYTWFQIFKHKAVNFIRTGTVIAIVTGIVWGSIEAYRYVHPEIYGAKASEIQKKEPGLQEQFPVLGRIAKAESRNSHFCTDDLIKHKMCRTAEKGQTLTSPNKNGTVDVGRYQINVDTWGAEATKLGYDIFNEKENEQMAYWIYRNYGTDPWYSSAKNW